MSKVNRIEINFASPVDFPDGFEQVLCGLVDMVCKQWEREHPTMVMWPAGQGSKPMWSKADAAFLGVSVASDAPDSGEPDFDDSVYCIDVEAREDYHGRNPHNPDRVKLQAEATEARRKRRESSSANLESWLKHSADQMSLYASTGSGPEKRAIKAWCTDVRTAAAIAREHDELLRQWLKFSSDVRPDCVAGIDLLNALRSATEWMLSRVECPSPLPGGNKGDS